jgi:hypothetical protein
MQLAFPGLVFGVGGRRFFMGIGVCCLSSLYEINLRHWFLRFSFYLVQEIFGAINSILY